METKEQLINTIKEWVKLDNDIRTLQRELGIRKKEKQKISERLISVMKQHEIDQFDMTDGNIKYSNKKVKKPITKKILLNILSKFYNGDDTKATELNEYILSNREEIIKETITRKICESSI